MTAASRQPETPRRLSAWLLAGLIAMPVLFLGFLFRDGYSTDIRIAGVSYALIISVFGIARALSLP